MSSATAEAGGAARRLVAALLLAASPLQDAPAAPAESAVPGVPGVPEGRVGALPAEELAAHDDAVVLVVGDVELRRSDVFRVLDLAVPARSAEVMQQMMLTTAAQLDARREGIDVPAGELARRVDQAIAEQRVSFALEVDESLPLEEYLEARHGLTPERYREEVRRMVLDTMLLERAVRLDQLRIDRDDVSVLLVEDEALARDLAAQIREGASFSVLARRHSVHDSAPAGGELGLVPREAQPPLLAGRDALEPGGLLGPEPIELGSRRYWRLLRLADRSAADASPWAELRERIEASLAERPLQGSELALFEARAMDRYRVRRSPQAP